MDFFFYSGPMERGADLRFMQLVDQNKDSEDVTLALCTAGGSPDAAYKICMYLQSRYSSVTVFVPGICKSAGTLLAIGASTIAFSPYGELGPLDVQMSKQDSMGLDSGLNIIEALSTLEDRARETFHTAIGETVTGSGGVVSFATAAHSSSELVQAMYAPIFAQIDPEEVGSRSRAMRIGEDYGRRLNQKFSNLRDNNAMLSLSRSYPSHGFVIDFNEARHLFNNVREATSAEKRIVEIIGDSCRFPERTLKIECLTEAFAQLQEDENGTKATGETGEEPESGGKSARTANGKNPAGTNGTSKVPPSNEATKAE